MAVDFNSNIPININYDGYNIDGDYITNGDVYTLIYNGVTVWTASTYLYQNGVLASGITASNFTTRDGYLFVSVSADNHEETDNSARLENVDLTNYSKLDIVVDYNTYANYGDSSVSYGIDSCWTTGLPNSNNDVRSTTITIDISSYTGTHYIGFGVWARNDSSESTWGAWADLWIKEIKLYN